MNPVVVYKKASTDPNYDDDTRPILTQQARIVLLKKKDLLSGASFQLSPKRIQNFIKISAGRSATVASLSAVSNVVVSIKALPWFTNR